MARRQTVVTNRQQQADSGERAVQTPIRKEEQSINVAHLRLSSDCKPPLPGPIFFLKRISRRDNRQFLA
jgi:hypothetical protein